MDNKPCIWIEIALSGLSGQSRGPISDAPTVSVCWHQKGIERRTLKDSEMEDFGVCVCVSGDVWICR